MKFYLKKWGMLKLRNRKRKLMKGIQLTTQEKIGEKKTYK